MLLFINIVLYLTIFITIKGKGGIGYGRAEKGQTLFAFYMFYM